MKRIWVNCDDVHTEVAVQESGKLMEYYKGKRNQGQLAGNIYIGRVVRVLQGMQSAFVDVGLERNGFLYIDDLLPAHLEKQPKEKPSIHDLVKEGQQIMVQVVKEPVGNKGARLTTHYSIPGRYGVYMPHADYIGVSRKIESVTDRERLKRMAERYLQPGEGFIVRTAALSETEEALAADLVELRGHYRQLEEAAKLNVPAPRLLYSDLEMLPRLIRDLFRGDVQELIVDSEQTLLEIRGLIPAGSSGLADRVKLQTVTDSSIANAIAKQLENGLRRKVWLDNGGYLIIDQTEALTVFDVNTGKYTGTIDLERTVFDTNMEAAREIARLLRLRDIGGLIVIDFIDMETENFRQAVLEELNRETRKDRTKTVVVGWTKLGLVELTRKKVRNSKETTAPEPCSACGGSGFADLGK
ncbi:MULTISPECIES: Rne/Rng family ribonuclease [unclassified Paenibacillus]|uniref:Rne/Rng family ribonuclease n=1 Tax=unclassified Paenibacillus TaxID=185978 RepID=UPI001AE94BC3|nr:MULTISPECIES: Rne/Rng family ribonuclease [unclassified Paenibacillus]MBP1156581.1 ribonuclease G [Paenibacillus sp. PvP091]MBP1172681.1 ribonuclease G [Paenibacillus sp. PvR098]MBP2439061.1 ribonuclease G [Paenibacillus sp. PvP052]